MSSRSCVAVPGRMTTTQDLSQADLRLSSLRQMPLRQLLEQVPMSA